MLKMIDLPYPLNALEPYYSAKTLDLHFNILYKGYIDNTNKTEEKLKNARNLLVWIPKWQKLEILQCEKHQNLTLWGCMPLLVLDMWEHSYYLQYQTNRQEYINAFWNILNWNEVNKRYQKI